jgi:hypothetical protein
MGRMAKHTKQPEVLGNDSFVIVECLARPTLADRLLRSWYHHPTELSAEDILLRARLRPTCRMLQFRGTKISVHSCGFVVSRS